MQHSARQAILFRQLFPPPHNARVFSFFGGAPVAPPSFVWPKGDNGGPLHFLMQIDCADIPAESRLGLLPERGVLFFFLDLDGGESSGFRVLFEDEPSENWDRMLVPPDLGPAYGDEARYVWGWTWEIDGARCPRLLPRWPFQPVAISFSVECADDAVRDAAEPVWWPVDKAVQNDLLQAQGAIIAPKSFREIVLAEHGGLTRPFESYPHDWHAIEICAGFLLRRIRRDLGTTGARAFRAMTAEERAALRTLLEAETREWFARARAYAPFAGVQPEDRDAFWAWLVQHATLSRFVLGQAVTISVEASLAGSADAAARIPADAAARLYIHHALAAQTEHGIFAPRPDRMLAPPSEIQGNQYEIARTHLLLLELLSNEGLGHHFGEGVYQFWITPDELRARRFDAVKLTADAY